MKRIVIRAAWVLALCLVAVAARAAERLYLWEARSAAGSAYLFGSIHLCRADCFPLPAAAVQALQQAAAFALELDPEQPAVKEVLMRRALYPEGDSLERHLSPALLSDLNSVLGNRGLPAPAVLRMKPWLAGTTITLMAGLQAGYTVEQGIDLWLLRQARERGKPVVELETAEQQVDSLERLPPQYQEALVAQAVALAGGDSIRPYLDDMVEAWRSGDTARLQRSSQAGLEDPELAQRMLAGLLVERNRAMAQRIAALVAEHKSVFVVVGALHLAGRDSILERLKAAGFEIRQLERAAATN